MRNKLLLSSLLSLSILAFSGTAKAQESADATFTGTLSASTEVVKIDDGTATIDPDTGELNIDRAVVFRVTTSQPTGTDGRVTVAPVSGIPTLFEVVPGFAGVALINGNPAPEAVANATSSDPMVDDNPNVIAYQIRAGVDGQPDFVFNNDGLEGVILDAPGSDSVGVVVEGTPRPGTFGTNDESGAYTANITLTAVSSL